MVHSRIRTASFTEQGIERLPDDKPVVYKIKDENGNNTYTGSAKRGRVRDRLKEHLPGGPEPISGGVKVEMQQKNSVEEAEKSESRIIRRAKPKYNKKRK